MSQERMSQERMSQEREARYTWDADNAPEVLEEGDGEELDLEGLMKRVADEAAAEVKPV